MKNEKQEMGYIEDVMEHVSQENHRQGIHIWLDVNDAGDGISLSTNDNFNQDYARMVKILGDVLSFFQTKLEEEKEREALKSIKMWENGESLENGGNENE